MWGRMIDIAAIGWGYQVKGRQAGCGSHVIVLFVHPRGQQQEPGSRRKRCRCDKLQQSFHVIVAVRWICHQNVKVWQSTGVGPNGITVLFDVMDLGKAQRGQIGHYSAIAKVGIVNAQLCPRQVVRLVFDTGRVACAGQPSQQGSNISIGLQRRLAMIVGIHGKGKVW
jgi:hypothetical protein